MEVIYKCGSEVVNKHSKSYNGVYSNPFGSFIPEIGDCVLLGEHTEAFTSKEYTPMVKYMVVSRTFSAIEDYNNSYSGKTCVVELKQVES